MSLSQPKAADAARVPKVCQKEYHPDFCPFYVDDYCNSAFVNDPCLGGTGHWVLTNAQCDEGNPTATVVCTWFDP